MAMPRAALLFAMALALGTSRAAGPSEAMAQLCNKAQTELVKCGSDAKSADPGTCCSLLEEYHKNGCFWWVSHGVYCSVDFCKRRGGLMHVYSREKAASWRIVRGPMQPT